MGKSAIRGFSAGSKLPPSTVAVYLGERERKPRRIVDKVFADIGLAVRSPAGCAAQPG
jgi:hypothetical protein